MDEQFKIQKNKTELDDLASSSHHSNIVNILPEVETTETNNTNNNTNNIMTKNETKTSTAVPMGAATVSQAQVREGTGNCEAISSLVCGILGLFAVGVILGPIAICLGMSAKSKIGPDDSGDCVATAGIVIGFISMVLSLFIIMFFLSA